MEQYIDKSALVAELEKKIKVYEAAFDSPSFASYDACLIAKGKYRKLLDILQFINTLEVKEVDLDGAHYKPLDEDFERDAVSFCFDHGLNTTPYIAKTIAKHFFELGIKTKQKGE